MAPPCKLFLYSQVQTVPSPPTLSQWQREFSQFFCWLCCGCVCCLSAHALSPPSWQCSVDPEGGKEGANGSLRENLLARSYGWRKLWFLKGALHHTCYWRLMVMDFSSQKCPHLEEEKLHSFLGQTDSDLDSPGITAIGTDLQSGSVLHSWETRAIGEKLRGPVAVISQEAVSKLHVLNTHNTLLAA